MEENARLLRREANIQGGALLIWMAILNGCVFAVMLAAALVQGLRGAMTGAPDMDAMLDGAMAASGWGYLLAVTLGLGALLLWKKPGYIRHTLCQKGRPMTPGAFFSLLALAMAPQLVAQLWDMGLVWLAEWLGLDGSALEALGTADADTASMFLYIGIAAPIAEELLFRGVLLRSVAPYGRKLAVFASALLFGLFHANPIQTPYAFLVGLVLGYAALEYHVGWAMALHLCNNLGFALLLPRALDFLPGVLVDWILWAVIIACFLAAVLVLIWRWDAVRAFWEAESVSPWQRRAFFAAPAVWILTALCLLSMTATVVLLFL